MLFTFFTINNISKYLILFILLLFLIILITNEPFGWKHSDTENNVIDSSSEIILARLSRAMLELNSLKSQNEELRNLIQSFLPSSDDETGETVFTNIQDNEHKLKHKFELDYQYEFSRRKLISDVNELWNYIRRNGKPENKNFIKELKNSLLYDLG